MFQNYKRKFKNCAIDTKNSENLKTYNKVRLDSKKKNNKYVKVRVLKVLKNSKNIFKLHILKKN